MPREEVTEYTISVKRTASTGPYETISVELHQTLEITDSQFKGAYKALSEKVELAVNHELQKYKVAAKKERVR